MSASQFTDDPVDRYGWYPPVVHKWGFSARVLADLQKIMKETWSWEYPNCQLIGSVSPEVQYERNDAVIFTRKD